MRFESAMCKKMRFEKCDGEHRIFFAMVRSHRIFFAMVRSNRTFFAMVWSHRIFFCKGSVRSHFFANVSHSCKSQFVFFFALLTQIIRKKNTIFFNIAKKMRLFSKSHFFCDHFSQSHFLRIFLAEPAYHTHFLVHFHETS